MKYVVIVLIIVLFGCYGYIKKLHYIKRKDLIEIIINYITYYDSRLCLLKTDLQEINKSYIILQKTKNANKYNFIIKNNHIYEYNYCFLKSNLGDMDQYDIFESYFKDLGTSDYEFEKRKNMEMKRLLLSVRAGFQNDIKSKGDLYFKIMLAIGVVVAILIW